MINQRIRPLAICLLRRGDHILVFEGYDRVKHQTFYRPLGGGIEFGENGAAAAAREVREEIGAAITGVSLIQTLENIFTYEGTPGHEIVLIYEARFLDPSFYQCETPLKQSRTTARHFALSGDIWTLLLPSARSIPKACVSFSTVSLGWRLQSAGIDL